MVKRTRCILDAREILLLGCLIFYGAFVAASAAVLGRGFMVAIAFGLPLVLLFGRCLLRMPVRALLLLPFLLWLWSRVSVRVMQALPVLEIDTPAYATAVPVVMVGIPLAWAAQKGWGRRKRRLRDARMGRLDEFLSRARWIVKHLSRADLQTAARERFAAEFEGGSMRNRLTRLLDEGRDREFSREISHLESVLDEIENLERLARRTPADGFGSKLSPYEVLVCTPESPFETIKLAYKSYCKYYHPDAVRGRGGDIQIANRKMREGNLAFEQIKRMRGVR